MINAGNAYRLPGTPGLGILKHVITYVPGLDLFLDSTAEAVEFGYLPLQELDKPVLLTKTGQIARTPAHQQDRMSTRLRFGISPEGSASFSFKEKTQGVRAELSRHLIRNAKPENLKQLARNWLKLAGLEGHGSLAPGNIDDEPPHELSLNGDIENLAALPGPTGMRAYTDFGSGISSVFAVLTRENERRQPFACLSDQIDEEAEFTFPAQTSIISLPKGIRVSNDFFDYESDYRLEKGRLVAKRFYKGHFPTSVCLPENFKRMKPDFSRILKDLRSQVILQGQ